MYRSHPAVALTMAGLLAMVLAGCDGKPGQGRNPFDSISSVLAPSDGPARLGPNISRDASAGDDMYKPHSNVDDQAAIALDAAEIYRAASQGNPAGIDLHEIYEKGKNARGSSARTLASDPDLATDFPDEAAYFGTPSFLDAALMDAINGTGIAAGYSASQRAQALGGGVHRLVAYSMLWQIRIAEAKLRNGDPDPDDRSHNYIDRAWAFYTASSGADKRPGSLAAAATALEGGLGREGAIDKPLRAALATLQDGADRRNLDVFLAARTDVEARLSAIFFLTTARQLSAALRAADREDGAGAADHQALGLTTYATIQAAVSSGDRAADQAISAYFALPPVELTVARRDAALAALNRVAPALNLKDADRVSAADL